MKAPAPKTSGLPNGWEYSGCFKDRDSNTPALDEFFDHGVLIVPLNSGDEHDLGTLACCQIHTCVDGTWNVSIIEMYKSGDMKQF